MCLVPATPLVGKTHPFEARVSPVRSDEKMLLHWEQHWTSSSSSSSSLWWCCRRGRVRDGAPVHAKKVYPPPKHCVPPYTSRCCTPWFGEPRVWESRPGSSSLALAALLPPLEHSPTPRCSQRRRDRIEGRGGGGGGAGEGCAGEQAGAGEEEVGQLQQGSRPGQHWLMRQRRLLLLLLQ